MNILFRRALNLLPDRAYIQLKYRVKAGAWPNLDRPATFSEKLQWLKLYDHNPAYTAMVDKYAVRSYVADKIGGEHLIPLLGVWDHPSDIDFAALPNQFVLKCNHNSGGGMCLCTDKSTLDVQSVIAGLERNLKVNYFWDSREWAYKDIPPRVLAEQFMKDEDPQNTANSLIDYKFYCFNGEPRFLYVGVDDFSSGKKGECRLTLLDLNWRRTPFYRDDHEQMPFAVREPDCFQDMLAMAGKLSQGIPFVRVDLYCISGKIYFSEMTLYPGGGFSPFKPAVWERKIGDWIQLPALRQ